MAMIIEDSYTSHELADRAGCTYRKLDLLVRAGRISPAIEPGGGSGSQRLYGQWQVGELVQLIEEDK